MRKSRFMSMLAAVAVALFVGVGSAQAATLQIQFSGLDLVYTGDSTGGTLCDAAGCGGGDGEFADADTLLTMTFIVDGNEVGTLNTNIAADINLSVDDGLESSGIGVATGTGVWFDLLTQASGWGLALNVADTNLILTNSTLQLTGSGTVSGIEGQDLPFGLEIGQPITWSFSSQDITESLTSSNGFVTSLTTAGTGEVTGPLVETPEPASVLLLGLGLLASGRAFRRRRQ